MLKWRNVVRANRRLTKSRGGVSEVNEILYDDVSDLVEAQSNYFFRWRKCLVGKTIVLHEFIFWYLYYY